MKYDWVEFLVTGSSTRRVRGTLAETLGYRFRMLSYSQCPPRDDRYWIAIMHTSRTKEDHATHAVCCRGRQLLHDQSDVFRAYQPSMLEYGLELVAV